MKLSLPLVIRESNKYYVMSFLYLTAVSLYLAAERFSIFSAQELTLTWIDRAVPLIPWTIWLYVSEYIFFVAVFFNIKSMSRMNEYFYSLLSLQLVCIPIFWLWPTVFPRYLFPLPNDMDSLTGFVFTALRSTDYPSNCCPSLHVSGVFISAFVLRDRKWLFPIFTIWATVITISTLTTKQHYVIDVAGGLAVALFIHFFLRTFANFKNS